MKSILKKAGEVGKGFADSVKEVVEDIKGEKAFIIEKFATTDALADRLNELQESMGTVNVQSVCAEGGFFVAIIKLED